MSYHVFISYPRIADERGAVSDIRAHLERELQIKTGDRGLVVFQDQSHLSGGDPWSDLLENELKVANVFLLLLCPLWLTSEWCRKEFNLYLACGEQEGRKRPIIPLRWDRTELTHARTDEEAEMLALIKKHQEVPWEKLRHRNSSYPGYFQAISDLAAAVAAKLVGQ